MGPKVDEAQSVGLTLLPRATAILAKGSLLAGNENGCAVNLKLVAVLSVITETSSVKSVFFLWGFWHFFHFLAARCRTSVQSLSGSHNFLISVCSIHSVSCTCTIFLFFPEIWIFTSLSCLDNFPTLPLRFYGTSPRSNLVTYQESESPAMKHTKHIHGVNNLQ